MKTDLFQSCGHCWVFQICWHIECSTFTASSFRIWNSSARIPSPPLALFMVKLSKAHLNSHSRRSGSMWVITPLWLSKSLRSFLYSSFVYSWHLFLISFASVRSFLAVSVLYCAHPCMKFPLVSPIFLKRSLVFPILLFSSISLLCSLKEAFLALLLFSGTLSSVDYIFPFLSLLFATFFPSAICKASSGNHFTFLLLFFFGIILVTASCTMLQISVHHSSGTLSNRSLESICHFHCIIVKDLI